MPSKRSQPAEDRRVYSEFDTEPTSDDRATARSRPEPPATQQDLRVQASRKGRKGKTVTLVTGFQAQPETLAELTKKLKAQCGAGGTVKDNQIEIQGDHRQTIVQALQNLGYKVKVSGG